MGEEESDKKTKKVKKNTGETTKNIKGKESKGGKVQYEVPSTSSK